MEKVGIELPFFRVTLPVLSTTLPLLMMTRFLFCCFIVTVFSWAAPADKATWIDPEVALREDPDFAIQGEYRSAVEASPMGVQVVALGGGAFDAYLLEGGLPGAGWEPGKARTRLTGARRGEVIEWSDQSKKIECRWENGTLLITLADGVKHTLTRLERKSPTLGSKPPAGAVVLFDGTSADAWEKGKMENGFLQATSCMSKQHFGDYTLHVEFRTPYKPQARGQARGNSGIYLNGRWETQVLDSFGLEGRDNECGGLYSLSPPRLNMCFPPLTWQTYDVDFTGATFDAAGKRMAWPRVTVRLNGVVVHEDLELKKDCTAAAPLSAPLQTAKGPIFLQDHGNPVVYRNIWVMPREQAGK